MTTVRVFPTNEALARAAADVIAEASANAIQARGVFHIALSGGSTPRGYLSLLATLPYKTQVGWTHWDVWWGDDRMVPHTEKESNVLLARETLFSKVPIPEENVHPTPTDLPPDQCADAYQAELVRVMGEEPRFDLVLLGIGEDGHTASLFPGTPELAIDDRLVIHSVAPKPPRDRVTFTFKTINASRLIVFVVEGEAKAEPLRQVLAHRAEPLPAAKVYPTDGRLLWLVDSTVGNGFR